MPTLHDLSNQIDSYCEQHGIAIEEYPLINQVKQYLQPQMGRQFNVRGHVGFLRQYSTPNETQLSNLVELFKPELQRWNSRETPSMELNLLPILVNAILPTCDRLPSFENMELDLEDIHFMEVKNSFSKAWRIPLTGRDARDAMNNARANARMVEPMTRYFLRKYAPDYADQGEKIVTAYLAEYHEDPFQMTASLIILAKKNLLKRENLRIIHSMANNTVFTHNTDFFCNLSTIAKSLVTLSRCSILSDETRSMIHEYMNFGATNQDWRVGLSVHDPDPTGLTFFFKLLVDLDMWSLANARLIFDNKKAVMEVIGQQEYHKPFAKLLHTLRDQELLTPAALQQIISNEWIFQNLANCAQRCLDIIPNHLWTADLLQQVITASSVHEYAAVSDEQLYQLMERQAPNIPGENSQSTHSMSVHTTVASSLYRLNDRYRLTESQINSKLSELEAFASELTSAAYAHLDDEHLGEMKTPFAAQSIQRLVALAKQNTVEERQTKFGLSKILALIWTGVQDESLHDTSLELVPRDKFINELYNIEVAYGVRADGTGAHSCDGGSINGLLLPLDRVHADVHIDLIDKAAVIDQTLNEAKVLFLEQFKSALSQERQSTFTQKYNAEIENTDWQDPEIQAWYTNCLEKTHASAIENMYHIIDAARIDDPSKIAELKQKSIVWIDIAMQTLSEDKYMLEPTKIAYEREKASPPAVAVADDVQEEVDKLSLDEKEVPKDERSRRNEEMRNARLRFYGHQSDAQPPANLSKVAGAPTSNTKK